MILEHYIYKTEYLALIMTLFLLYYEIKGSYLFFIVTFFVFDVGAIGYLISEKIGNLFYNLGHTLIIPLVLTILCLVSSNIEANKILAFSVVWLIHIFIDRIMGWGLMPRQNDGS